MHTFLFFVSLSNYSQKCNIQHPNDYSFQILSLLKPHLNSFCSHKIFTTLHPVANKLKIVFFLTFRNKIKNFQPCQNLCIGRLNYLPHIQKINKGRKRRKKKWCWVPCSFCYSHSLPNPLCARKKPLCGLLFVLKCLPNLDSWQSECFKAFLMPAWNLENESGCFKWIATLKSLMRRKGGVETLV